MKSNKQRRDEIKARRRQRAEKEKQRQRSRSDIDLPIGSAPCNPLLLAPNNSNGTDFLLRGYYLDYPFRCQDCGKEEIWRATQQKWWFEVAKADVNTRAIRCRSCRKLERQRKSEARRVHLEGIRKKVEGIAKKPNAKAE